jgi:threonine dehydrogenase-like Zn-dependent dehydrogenase
MSVIDAVGMEAHGAPVGRMAHKLARMLPDALAQQVMQTVGIDRLSALHMELELVQRGGTVSLSGVYGGAASLMPLLQVVRQADQPRRPDLSLARARTRLSMNASLASTAELRTNG